MIALSLGDVLLRLTIALLLGAGVGIERERTRGTKRAAGMRTLALVSMGSALFMIISAYGFTAFTSAAYAKVDPSRIAAQIVTGIGFIGAGTILLHRQVVRGLTTAAAIWVVAGIGMACGLDMLVEAISATALGLVVLTLLRPVERLLVRQGEDAKGARGTRATQRIQLSITRDAGSDVLRAVQAVWEDAHLRVDSVETRPSAHGDIVKMHSHEVSAQDLMGLVNRLRALPGVRAVRADLNLPMPSGADE